MANLQKVVKELLTERKKVQNELSRLDAAIAALGGNNGSGDSQPFLHTTPDVVHVCTQTYCSRTEGTLGEVESQPKENFLS